MNEFIDWLNSELRAKDWSQADLARATGLTRGAISNIINNQRAPKVETLVAIANGLNMPAEQVLRIAGRLPEEVNPRQVAAEILGYKLGELNQNQLDEVIQFIEFIQDRDTKKIYRIKSKRQGEAPAEMIK